MSENVVVVSDLHLGAPSSLLAIQDVHIALVERLLKLGEITALVLLGDILDLTRAPQTAWREAAEFFRELFSRSGHALEGARVHCVLGNHDHHAHALLVENADILSPLQQSAVSGGGAPVFVEHLKLAPRVFPPEEPTFFHGLFPNEVRKRVWIWYPFIDISLDERQFLFHHGHYFDRRITPLAASVVSAESNDHAMQLIEEYNWAILESAFYLSSIGRSSRELTMGLYIKLKSLFDKWSSLRIHRATGKMLGGLSWDYTKEVVKSLYGKSSYTLVFGHTHCYDSHTEALGDVVVFNTGGWMVEEDGVPPDTGILHICDGVCEWKSVVVPREYITRATGRAKMVRPRNPRIARLFLHIARSLKS